MGFDRYKVVVMKKAALFSGQGSQYVGMGRDLWEEFPLVRGLFQEANDALGFDLRSLCFEGPEEELRLTERTQPAIFTVIETELRINGRVNEDDFHVACSRM